MKTNAELGITAWIDEAEQMKRDKELSLDPNWKTPDWMKQAGREFQQVRNRMIINADYAHNIVRPYKLNELEKN